MYALLACWWTVLVPVSLLLLLLLLPSLCFPLSPPWVVGASACLALLFLQATTLYGTLVRIGRVGACPSSTYHDLEKEEDVVVVGGGWSWYLQGRRASGGRVYTTRHLRGRLSTSSDDGEWWGAGSTIAEVQRSLARRGLSLSGHPSILTATLGGWMASRSHGSGGTLWTPSTRRLRVYDREEGRVKVVARKQDLVFSSRYVVLAVEVLPVPNVSCLRVAFDLTTESDARRYLTQPSYVRVLFVHAGGATCFLWQDSDEETRFAAARLLYPPWLWTLLPCGCFPRAWWTARTTLRDAHAFAPTPPLVSTAFASTLFLNFELFVKLSSSSSSSSLLSSSLLLALCQRLREEVCGRHGGRCEVRGGGSARRGGTLFLDVVLPTRSAAKGSRAVLRVVHDLLGRDVTLHPGKGRPRGEEEEGVSNDWERGGTAV